VSNNATATHDGVVLVTVFNRIEHIGEVPSSISGGDLRHEIRLSDVGIIA